MSPPLTSRSNSTRRIVPPEKSMPSGRPPRAMVATPAIRMSPESASACQRQRMKLKLVFERICIVLGGWLDAQLHGPRRLPRQNRLEHRPRHEHGGEDVGDETEEQRRGKAANGTGAELEQKRRRDQRRDVRVENRHEDAIEAGSDGLPRALAGGELFSYALEDQHVRVDAHADREDEAGDARQGHGRAEIRHEAKED